MSNFIFPSKLLEVLSPNKNGEYYCPVCQTPLQFQEFDQQVFQANCACKKDTGHSFSSYCESRNFYYFYLSIARDSKFYHIMVNERAKMINVNIQNVKDGLVVLSFRVNDFELGTLNELLELIDTYYLLS